MFSASKMTNLQVFMRYCSIQRSDFEGLGLIGGENTKYMSIFSNLMNEDFSGKKYYDFANKRYKIPFEFGIIPLNLSLSHRTMNGVSYNDETKSYDFHVGSFATRPGALSGVISPHTYYDVHGFDGITPTTSTSTYQQKINNITSYLGALCNFGFPNTNVQTVEMSYISNGGIDTSNGFAGSTQYCKGNSSFIRMITGKYHILGSPKLGSTKAVGNSPDVCFIGVSNRTSLFANSTSYSVAQLAEIQAILNTTLSNFDFSSSSFVGTVYNKTTHQGELVLGERALFRNNYYLFDSKFLNVYSQGSDSYLFESVYDDDDENAVLSYATTLDERVFSEVDLFDNNVLNGNHKNARNFKLPKYHNDNCLSLNQHTTSFNDDTMTRYGGQQTDTSSDLYLGYSTYIALIPEAMNQGSVFRDGEGAVELYTNATGNECYCVSGSNQILAPGIPTFEFLPMYYVSLDDCENVDKMIQFVREYLNYNYFDSHEYSRETEKNNFENLSGYTSTLGGMSITQVLDTKTAGCYNDASVIYCEDTNIGNTTTTSKYLNIKGVYEISETKDAINELTAYKTIKLNSNNSYNYYLVYCNYNLYLVPKTMFNKYVWESSDITAANLVSANMIKKYYKAGTGSNKDYTDTVDVSNPSTSTGLTQVNWGYVRVNML